MMQLDERKAAAMIAEALRDQIEVARVHGFAMPEYRIGSALVEADRLEREASGRSCKEPPKEP